VKGNKTVNGIAHEFGVHPTSKVDPVVQTINGLI
jgi:hypothetical protein